MEALFQFGLVLFMGYLFGSVASLLKLPRVSGYILAGMVMSPSLLGIVDREFLDGADLITHASLSLITFLIGASLSWRKVKKLGKSMVFITLGEAELAFLTVFITMTAYLLFFQEYDPALTIALALLFGALASPTDPTATLAVIHESRARGPLTTTVLGVAALDDATGILNFVLGFSVASALASGTSLSIGSTVWEVVFQIFGALLLGFVMGLGMFLLGKLARSRKEAVTLTVGVLFLTFSVARTIGVDELLSTMSVGITIANIGNAWEEFEKPLENYIEDLIFTAFFVVGSAFLDLKALLGLFPVVLVYILSRFAGKFAGTYMGGYLSEAPEKVRRYLAFALFPQGGIVIGLALLASQDPNFKEAGSLLVNVVIGAAVVHELLGPISSKFALTKAEEVPSG